MARLKLCPRAQLEVVKIEDESSYVADDKKDVETLADNIGGMGSRLT